MLCYVFYSKAHTSEAAPGEIKTKYFHLPGCMKADFGLLKLAQNKSNK